MSETYFAPCPRGLEAPLAVEPQQVEEPLGHQQRELPPRLLAQPSSLGFHEVEASERIVQEETLVLPDGTTKRGFVHRKGATRAFPAGHPDLAGTIWEQTGHPCLVPGSMKDGAAILYPLNGAFASGCSVNHGSGRVLARGQAKRELAARQDEIDAEMRDIVRTLGGVEVRGIVGNTKRTPLDECGHVYKELDEVLRVLEAEGIARVANRMYPVANIKGTD